MTSLLQRAFFLARQLSSRPHRRRRLYGSHIEAGSCTAIARIDSLESRCLLSSHPVLALGQVTSSTVEIGWEPVPGASGIRVYLAPEPSAAGGDPLPGAVQIATLPGAATSYHADGLAASVDTFFRVEADVAGQTFGSNIHARTLGGQNSGTDQRASELDTPLRSVHAQAPDMLMLVLADFDIHGHGGTDNDGAMWQSENWNVTRADGTPIDVTHVYRQSFATGQWDYIPGYAGYANTIGVDADHYIYLQLDENIGSRDVLTIDGPRDLAFTLPFSDRYLETRVIQVNQVGYNPRATERFAYVSGWLGDGGYQSLADFPDTADVLIEPDDPLTPRSTAEADLPLTLRSSFDVNSGTEVEEIDLSSVPAAEGVRYRVHLPGVGVSWATAVSEEAAFKAYYTVLRGLYHNRWAGDLDPQYTEWSRPVDHMTRPDGTSSVYRSTDISWLDGNGGLTGFFPSDHPTDEPITVRGGHHDAGDFDLRAMHTKTARTLMRAFELNPTKFTDGQLNIPESGNGIPDLLDEAIWSLNAWVDLQNPDGGVHAGVESYRHPHNHYLAHEDPLPYWTWAVDVDVTARAAGLFAQAAYLVAPFDAALSADLESRAISAYSFAEAGGAQDAYLLYASSELFRLTGGATYQSDFQTSWDNLNLTTTGTVNNLQLMNDSAVNYFRHHDAYPDYVQGYLDAVDDPQSSQETTITTRLDEVSADLLERTDEAHAFRNQRPVGMLPNWGMGSAMGNHLDPVIARLQLGGLTSQEEQDYFNALSVGADYVLGANELGMSLIAGLGTIQPLNVLHLDSLAFVKQGLGNVPGIPVYGAVFALPSWYPPGAGTDALYPQWGHFPLMRRFADHWPMVITTEFTSHEVQVAHGTHFAALLGDGQSPTAAHLPGGTEHRNPRTSHGNAAPVVDAGPDQTIVSPAAQVTLAATVDDRGGITGTLWTVVSGPGTVTFGDDTAIDTTATLSRSGSYELRLTADDVNTLGFDSVTITLLADGAGVPNVDAGPVRQLYLPDDTLLLDGTVTDDGPVTTQWELVAGPSGMTVEFSNPTAVDTAATFPVAGTYTLQLSADDGTSYSADRVTVIVNPANRFHWAGQNEPDANTLALHHLDETAGLTGDNAEGTADRDLIADDSSVWTEADGWGGSGGHFDATDFGAATSATTIPTDWSNGMTVSFWMKTSDRSFETKEPVRLQGNPFYQNSSTLQYRWDWNLVQASTHNTGSRDLARGGFVSRNDITDGRWHHYALVYMGDATGKGRFYIDNVLQIVDDNGVTEWDASGGVLHATAELLINAFGGQVDEILIQNAAITDFSNGLNSTANAAPVVDAGTNQSITLPTNQLGLDANVADDGRTAGPVTATWSLVNGPAAVAFDNPNLIDATATFSQAGTYRLRLQSDDGEKRGFDDVLVTVVSPNNVPDVNDDYYTMTQGEVLNVIAPAGLLANDSDDDNDILEVELIAAPPTGNLTVFPNGAFQFIPAAITYGEQTFTYRVSDGHTNSAEATVTVNVNPLVELGAKLYESDFATDVSGDWDLFRAAITPGEGLHINKAWDVFGTAHLADAATIHEKNLQIDAVVNAASGNPGAYLEIGGRATHSSDGVRVRIWGGWLEAKVELFDGNNLLFTETIDNLASSRALIHTQMLLEDDQVTLLIYQQGTDDWPTLSRTITETLTASLDPGTVRFAGTAFTVASTLSELTVHRLPTVGNAPPTATDGSITLNEGSSRSGTLTASDDDAADQLTWIIVTPPANGALTAFDASDGSFTYEPEPGYSGPDQFHFLVTDGIASDVATQTVTVNSLSQVLYETDFSTDVSADWDMTRMTIVPGTGMLTNSGWGNIGYAELTGDETIDVVDVTITTIGTVAGGNPNGYLEIAGRTSGPDTGVSLRVYGAWRDAKVEILEGTTVVATDTINGLRTQFAPTTMTLALSGTSALVTLEQTAGSSGSQTWNDLTATLSATISTYVDSGNVRIGGKSYTTQPVFHDVLVEGIIPPTNEEPVADAGGHYSISEGQSLILDASGSLDPDDGQTLTFTWTVNGNSLDPTSSATTNLTWSDLQDLGIDNGTAAGSTFTVELLVEDNGEPVLSATDSATLTLTNSAPTASLGNNGPVDEGGSVDVSFSNQSDPSESDVTAGFSYSYDFDNDGVFDLTGSDSSVSVPGALLDDGDSSLTVSARITDQDGGYNDYTTTVDIRNVAPSAGIDAPTAGVRGQTQTLVLSASDPSGADTTAGFTFSIDWNNDGTADESVRGPSGQTVTRVFESTGSYRIAVTATDKDSDTSSTIYHDIEITEILLLDGNLFVGGSTGSDRIFVDQRRNGTLRVRLNRGRWNDLDVTGTVSVWGQAGNDFIRTTGRFDRSVAFYGGHGRDRLFGGRGDDLLSGDAGNDFIHDSRGNNRLSGGDGRDMILGGRDDDWIDAGPGHDFVRGGRGDDLIRGGDGNDWLDGGTGDDVVLGGDGNDYVLGRHGRDLLVGGLGRDFVIGSSGEDILIAGYTVWDSDDVALNALRDEWTSARSYADRIRNLSGVGTGVSLNGGYTLQAGITVFDDDKRDIVLGRSRRDWFFFGSRDLSDRRIDEVFANDLNPIGGE